MTNGSTDRRRRAALQAVTLTAALAVGILIGRSACAPEPKTETVVEKKIVERTPECPPCNPDTGVPEPDTVAAASGEPPEEKGDRAMPEAPEPPDPEIRRRLLSWVRDQAAGLRPCRPGGGSTVRLAVTLTLADDGTVEQADINAPDEELPQETLTCLRRRMTNWQLPKTLIEGRKRVVFGLDV